MCAYGLSWSRRLVARPLGNEFSLELGERQQHAQHQPAHRRGSREWKIGLARRRYWVHYVVFDLLYLTHTITSPNAGASEETTMKWGKCRFGSLKIDGEKYTRDVILDQGEVRKRKKKPSREFQEHFGHTPVSPNEEIPWQCKRLVIGTGLEGRLPVMDEVKDEAQRRGVELVARPTPEAVQYLKDNPADTNAILHVTC